MEQQHSPESDQNFVRNPITDLNTFDLRIDAYLNRTCASLFLSLPQEEALQQRAEMQSHLDSLVAAYMELGASKTEAVTQALAQFGKEQSVAQAWKQECETAKVEAGRGTFPSAIRPVAGYLALNWVVFPLLIEFYSFLVNGYGRIGHLMPKFLAWIAILVFFSEYSLFPAFLGFLAGRRARGKILVASVLALPFLDAAIRAFSMRIYQSFGWFLPPPGLHYHLTLVQELMPSWLFLGFGALGAGAACWRHSRKLRLAGSR